MDYKDFAEALLEELNNDNNHWIVMVDEMPIFVLALLNDEKRQRTHDFLYWLRNLRQRYSNVLWLYTGSIGLDTVSRREDLEGAFNNMQPFTLPPFGETEASEFLKILAQRDGFVLADTSISHILQRLGWLSPYYLEKLVDEIIPTGNDNEASLEDADRAFEALLSRGKQLYWSAWREHLNNNFKEPEQSLLYKTLETIAKAQDGADFNTLLGVLSRSNPDLTERQLRHTLDILESDGYLVVTNPERSRFRFLMELLRLWWLRYVV